MSELRNHANLIWGIAELLRGDYKQSDYGKVILPLVVLRRLDQTLEASKAEVLAKAEQLDAAGIENQEPVLVQFAGQQFYNRSRLSLSQLLDDPPRLALNFRAYIDGYSRLARAVMENFDFDRQIDRLDQGDLLYQVIARICEVDLHPERVSNLEMGYLFEELIRRFSEQSNETAGEHFTPREVVKLMVNLLLDGDEEALRDRGIIRTVFDCACGTGGMLSEAQDHIRALNPNATVHLYGQELNPESYAICLADMLVKGQDASHIVLGNSLSADGHQGERFHYGIANPPFGVDWSKVEREVRDEHTRLGYDGRFGPGLPRKSDGQLLFLMHLVSKMRDPGQGGGRVAIVHNGSPLFTGGVGSGESEIRRYLIEHDLLEAIVALPEQLFYNTGISSYVWLLTNRKSPQRQGKVQLIDARAYWGKMRKALGEKRREVGEEQIEAITRLHGGFADGDQVKIVDNADLGYRTFTVDKPLRGYWHLRGEAFSAQVLEGTKAFGKLDPELQSSLIETLNRMEEARFSEESAAMAAIGSAITSVIPRAPVALRKALVALAFVRDRDAPVVQDGRGAVVADPDLRDLESIPLTEDVQDYFNREVSPHAADAWVEDTDGKVGFEIAFTRLFYRYQPPRPSAQIKQELRQLEAEMRTLLDRVLK